MPPDRLRLVPAVAPGLLTVPAALAALVALVALVAAVIMAGINLNTTVAVSGAANNLFMPMVVKPLPTPTSTPTLTPKPTTIPTQ